MKIKFYLIFLFFCAVLALVACQDSVKLAPNPTEPFQEVTEPDATLELIAELDPVPLLSQREKDWIEDIEFLREKYKAEHMDPFYVCSEEEFDWRLDHLESKVNLLSDEDIFYELKAVIAGMGDLHTSISPSEALSNSIYGRCFPILARCFGGRLYLYGYLEGYEQFAPYLLKEIVAVNGIDVTYLAKKSASIEKPFNDWSSKEWFGRDCFYPVFLDWAGCDYKEGYVFQFLNENQEVESIEVPVIASTDASEGVWTYPENWERLYCGRSGDWAEYVEGENGGCICMHYVNLASVLEIMAIFDATAELIEEHPDCSKLVIDLRDHPGGSPDRIPLVRECAKLLDAPSIEQTYVITGGYTASGAIECLSYFQNILDAVVIGEPTGQFASFFWVEKLSGKFVLPNSQLTGWISNSWYETEPSVDAYYDEDGKLYEWEYTILPDVYIHQNIEDIRQGKDSVLQWVLAQEK